MQASICTLMLAASKYTLVVCVGRICTDDKKNTIFFIKNAYIHYITVERSHNIRF